MLMAVLFKWRYLSTWFPLGSSHQASSTLGTSKVLMHLLRKTDQSETHSSLLSGLLQPPFWLLLAFGCVVSLEDAAATRGSIFQLAYSTRTKKFNNIPTQMWSMILNEGFYLKFSY
jgi:hypothetical protein